MSSVCEGKLWDGKGDPEVQAAASLVASLRHEFTTRMGDYPDKFPCMIVYFWGTFICFSGGVLTDRLHLETLTPAFPVHTNCHEDEIASQAARTLGAFRHAIEGLKTYYMEVALAQKQSLTNGPYEDLLYPYMRHYFNNENKKIDFRYVRRLHNNKLLFLCENTSNQNLCVKFTKRYSEVAHRHCAAHGMAPKLYKVEPLPGGWIMIVMEFLDEEVYGRLLTSDVDRAALAMGVQRVLSVLHQGGFVHGDLRDVNLMVRRERSMDGEERNVLLVDFDWAGPEGATFYPPNVNREDIFRPVGAIDKKLITREHDIAMVHHMLSYHCPRQFTFSYHEFLASQ